MSGIHVGLCRAVGPMLLIVVMHGQEASEANNPKPHIILYFITFRQIVTLSESHNIVA